MEYIAVVSKHDRTKSIIERNAVCAGTKAEAIQAAIDLRESWKGTGGPYRIFVGTLTEEVVTPVAYDLRPLDL